MLLVLQPYRQNSSRKNLNHSTRPEEKADFHEKMMTSALNFKQWEISGTTHCTRLQVAEYKSGSNELKVLSYAN